MLGREGKFRNMGYSTVPAVWGWVLVSANLITFRHKKVARKHNTFNELGPISAICSFLCGEMELNGHTVALFLLISSIPGYAHHVLEPVKKIVTVSWKIKYSLNTVEFAADRLVTGKVTLITKQKKHNKNKLTLNADLCTWDYDLSLQLRGENNIPVWPELKMLDCCQSSNQSVRTDWQVLELLFYLKTTHQGVSAKGSSWRTQWITESIWSKTSQNTGFWLPFPLLYTHLGFFICVFLSFIFQVLKFKSTAIFFIWTLLLLTYLRSLNKTSLKKKKP